MKRYEFFVNERSFFGAQAIKGLESGHLIIITQGNHAVACMVVQSALRCTYNYG